MIPPIQYQDKWLDMNPDVLFDMLWTELQWVRRSGVPRREYYCNEFPVPYTYGKDEGRRTYQPQPFHSLIRLVQRQLTFETSHHFETCFLNGYEDGKDQLGWHSDDSPEMDDERPIAIVSLYPNEKHEREIWFRNRPDVPSDVNTVYKMKLANGSLCLMKPFMQDEWQHRIPKSEIGRAHV